MSALVKFRLDTPRGMDYNDTYHNYRYNHNEFIDLLTVALRYLMN